MHWTMEPVVGDYVLVPRLIVEPNKTITLAADIFFVNGTAFLLTVLRQIKFITAEQVATCTAKSLSKIMNRVIQVYARTMFNVRTILMDGEFEKAKDELLLVVCNTTAAKEHVSKAKRSICTIKERAREIIGTLPLNISRDN